MLPTRSPQPELFKNARKKLKYSQARLARKLGVHRSTISRIEQGTQCPNIQLIEGIERLTGKTAEAIVADAYWCTTAQEKLAQEAVAMPTDRIDYLHIQLYHEDALKKLKSRLRHTQRELATVKRCMAIDRSTLAALTDQVKGWEDIVELLAPAPDAQQNAREYLRQFKENHQKKDRMALIWAQRYTFQMEDEILLIKREIASRERLRKVASDKVEELLALKQALVEAKKEQTARPKTSTKLGREETPRNTKAPPEATPSASPPAPRLKKDEKPGSDTAPRRKRDDRGREV
ncbi:MAG: helix-turn-helix domain-containing protein [Salibacteraceae bacterium]